MIGALVIAPTGGSRVVKSRRAETLEESPRIYNLFPSLVGPVASWTGHLDRIRDMGFNWVFVNSFHFPGFSGSLYAVKDYYRLNPLFRGDDAKSDDAILAAFAEAAAKRGLSVMMDLVVNHTAKDSVLAAAHPGWFAHEPDGSLRSPRAVDPDDPSRVTVWGDLAEIDYGERAMRAEIVAYWRRLVAHYAGLGFRAFRGDAAYKVPSAVWRDVISAAREAQRDAIFVAETLGCRLEEVAALHDAGFDYLFNSSKWWDFRAPWLMEQYDAYRRIAPTIAFPESHDTERLTADLARDGVTDPAEIEAAYRQRYLFAAAFSAGVMLPLGYEYGFRRKMDVVKTRPSDWESPLFDLSDFIAEANRLKASLPALNAEGPQACAFPREGLVAFHRGGGEGWVLTLINADRRRAHKVAFRDLAELDIESAAVEVTPAHNGTRLDPGAVLRLAPSEARIFRGGGADMADRPRRARRAGGPPAAGRTLAKGLSSRPIIIQNVNPEVDCGRFPVKREVGELLEVWADIFKEGHDRIAAVVRHRRRDEAEWHETPMTLVDRGLDRWRAAIRLEENARYLYTIEAWPDAYESWREEVEKKREAGQRVAVELLEGRAIVAGALRRARAADRSRIRQALAEFDRIEGEDERTTVLSSALLRAVMVRAPDRARAVRYERELEVVVDRPAARFAAWYEMFPRSQGREPERSATFDDCIARLDEVRAMGFDVLYLVPIHPIGRTNRKGSNNALAVGLEDPGSPYAIGAAEGGHDAVHPGLGTLEDFRRLVAECRARDMEVALDIAIQCSPDHPWLKQHPEWFEFRPDGTVKNAENPPKKYQDIINVNFHCEDRDALWLALRDVILFWVEQGVKTFRVDNPHTKPVPFWEWLIRAVQGRHPDTIFLSEAFTRPPMLKMLAKIGFTQSYTYFTWRNFKDEITAYLVELTQSECAEYLRPNFFTNTPDILPPFLQTGGRPAFQIRLVLAATMASVYGIYNGFELCEAAAIPGTEEYRDSEKYQYKVWNWDRPGHIKDYIAAVNRIRRENPALHYLRNLRFYRASNANVIFYGKMTADRGNMVFVVVNLDPFDVRESEIEFPLAEMGVPEGASFEVEELLSDARHLWTGAVQTVQLDPDRNPAAIYRVKAAERIDYRAPSL